MKKLALLTIFTLSLLVARPPDQHYEGCGIYWRYVRINSVAGFSLNPDVYNFIFSSQDPGLLFQKQSQRQSRPLFILMGTTVGYSIYFISWPVHKYLESIYRKLWTGKYPEGRILMIGDFFAGYILINFFLLWFTL